VGPAGDGGTELGERLTSAITPDRVIQALGLDPGAAPMVAAGPAAALASSLR